MSAWMKEFSNLATAYYNARRARGDFASSDETDALSYRKKQLDVEGKFLENVQKKRELQDISPKMKYMEKERSEQVTSALGTFADQWKGASAASKDLLEEQMRGLHGMMTKSEVAQSEMIIKRTPLNPRVQRGLWFDETNPEPTMPVTREGNTISTPPMTEENWAIWGEYRVKHSEWKELREMVVAGKEGGKKEEGRFKTIPRHYQTLKPKVTMYRCPRTKELKFFDWSVGKEPEILNAIEKGLSTENQMMIDGAVPLRIPLVKEMNGGTVSIQPFRIAGAGHVELVSTSLSPIDEGKAIPSEGLTEALDALMGGTDIESKDFRIKDPGTLRKYRDLKHVWEGYKKDAGKVFGKKEKFGPPRLAALQSSLMSESIPTEKKFIPFLVPAEMATELSTFWNKIDWIPFVNPGPGVGKDKFVLVPADRMVKFTWRNQHGTEKEKRYCWSSLYKVAYDKYGMPVKELTGKTPFTTIQFQEGAD